MSGLNRSDVRVGARIHIRREELRIAPEDLARAARISVVHLVVLESGEGRADAEILYEIARFLRVRSAYFFDENIEAPPETH